MPVWMASGHLDLTEREFELHYVHQLEAALAHPDARFVMGDARGADTLARCWLEARSAEIELFCRRDHPSAAARDAAMTAASDQDIAWVRPGRSRSGTAKNLARRRLAGPCEVRALDAADWRRYRSLRLTALGEAPDAFGSTLSEEQDQPDTLWQDRLSRPRVTTLVATLGHPGRDVGLAVVAPAWEEPLDIGLFSVWVAPEARGHSVGEAICRSAIEAARQGGARRLLLEVGDHNAPAIALYARMGFAPTGRTTRMAPPREHILEHERALSLT